MAIGELLDVTDELKQTQELWETKFDSDSSKEIVEERKNLADELVEVLRELDAAEYIHRGLTTTNYQWLRMEGRSEGLNQNGSPTTSVSEIKRVNNLKILDDIEENLISLINQSEGNSALWEAFQLTQEIIGESLETLSEELRGALSLKATKAWRSCQLLAQIRDCA